MQHSRYGDFVRYNGVPGYMAYDYAGYFRVMTSVTKSRWISGVQSIEMLYVDCKDSVKNMSVAKLSDIVVDRAKMDDLVETPVTKNREVIIKLNKSDQKKSYDIDIDIPVQDSVILSLDVSHKELFTTFPFSYDEWESTKYVEGQIRDNYGFDFLEYIGLTDETFEVMDKVFLSSNLNQTMSGIISKKCAPADFGDYSDGKVIMVAKSEERNIKFTQSVDVPAHAKVSVTPVKKSIKGSVPFTAMYKLTATKPMTPSDQTDANFEQERYERLAATLEKYTPKGIKITRNPTEKSVMVQINGTVVIEAKNEIDIHVASPVSLPGDDYDDYWNYN